MAQHLIYIAAPAEYSDRARSVGESLESMIPSCRVVSRWHATPVVKYPGEATFRRSAVEMNIADIVSATLVLMLGDLGTPRSALCEVAYALALRIPVVWIQGQLPEQRTIFDAHELVYRLQWTDATNLVVVGAVVLVGIRGHRHCVDD